MKKVIFLILLSIYSQLLAKDVNAINVEDKIKRVFVVNYIKNTSMKDKIKKYFTSFEDRFINTSITYKSFKDNSFYDDFREKGLSFLNDFMIKNKQDVVFIFYQKRKTKKITIISQKVKVNATRNISISSKKFSKEILYEKIISKSLKMLGELLIINPSDRRI